MNAPLIGAVHGDAVEVPVFIGFPAWQVEDRRLAR